MWCQAGEACSLSTDRKVSGFSSVRVSLTTRKFANFARPAASNPWRCQDREAPSLLPGACRMKEVVIVSAVRTAVGKFQGSLQSFSAPQLGALVVREAVRRADVTPAQIDECIMGCVLQAGLGQAPARQAAILGGLPPEASALTVNQVCGSGLRAVSLAAQAIQTGDAEVMVAGGM